MDILTKAEILLRENGFNTWSWNQVSAPAICFENHTIAGFLFNFPSVEVLLSEWQKVQDITVQRHAPALRASGTKAWNIYSCFLTSDSDSEKTFQIDKIEEDFSVTRKIAGASITSSSLLAQTLLPILPIRSKATVGDAEFEGRLRDRISDLPKDMIEAFFSDMNEKELGRKLGDGNAA